MSDLSTRDIKFLPGVGPKKAELFNKELKIFSFEDLLYYFPYKYIDRSRTYKIKEIDGNMPYIQLRGEILNFETQGEGKGRRLIARFSEGQARPYHLRRPVQARRGLPCPVAADPPSPGT